MNQRSGGTEKASGLLVRQTGKRCPHCHCVKPLEAFYVKRNGHLASWCKECEKRGQIYFPQTALPTYFEKEVSFLPSLGW